MTAGLAAPRRSTALGYALLAPSLFGVVAFLLLPILVVVWLSLHRWDLLGPIEYVGGQNWRSVLSDSTFGNSLLVTLTFVAIVVPAQTVLGLAVAALLARDLPGSGMFRTLYVLPWICVPLAIAVLWRWILAPTDGAISTVLGHRIEWLTDPGLALPVVSAVVVWANVGYVALFFLAGIQRAERRRKWCGPPCSLCWSRESSAPHRFSTSSTRSPAADPRTTPIWSRIASTRRRSEPRRSAGPR